MKLRHTQKITNEALLLYPMDGESRWFPIYMDGHCQNLDEFISLKMKEYNLKTPSLVRRALQSVGVE